MPSWAKVALDAWLEVAGIDEGRVFSPPPTKAAT